MSRSGGTERYIQRSCELLREKYSTFVITFDGGKTPFFKLPNETKLLSLPRISRNRINQFYCSPFFTILFKRIVKKNIIAKEIFLFPVTLRVNRFSLDSLYKHFRVVVCEHRSFDFGINDRQVKFIRKNLSRAHAIIALTELDFHKYRKIHRNVHLIYNYTSAKTGFVSTGSSKKMRLIGVGNFEKRKGFDRLLGVAILLKQAKIPFMLELFGNTNHDLKFFKKIQNKILSNELENHVLIKGIESDLDEIYESKDCLLMSSREEAFGYVVIEAKSYSVPTITFSSATGPIELVGNKFDGYHVDENNQMADFLIKLYQEPEKLLSMKKNSFSSYQKKYSPESVMKSWDQLFQSEARPR